MLQKIFFQIIGTFALVNSLTVPLEKLPEGDYQYTVKEGNYRSLLVRKSGFTVIGIEQTPLPNCFRGMVKENKIVNVMRLDRPYNSLSKWEYTKGEVYDLDNYWVKRTIKEQKSLSNCVKVFWRGNL